MAIIGNNWLSVKDQNNNSRLYNENDFVRIEIERAIKRKIIIIPILIDDSPLPEPEHLPKSIQLLSYRNAIKVRPSKDFDNDIEQLANEIKKHIKRKSLIKRKTTYYYATLFILLLSFSHFTIGIHHENKLNNLHDEFSKIRSDFEVNENSIITAHRYNNIKNNLPSLIENIENIKDYWLSNDSLIQKHDLLLFSYFIISAIYAREYKETSNESFKKDSLKTINHAIQSKEFLFHILKEKNINHLDMNGVYHIIANTYAVAYFLDIDGSFKKTEEYLMRIDSIYKQQMNIYNDYFLQHYRSKKNANNKS